LTLLEHMSFGGDYAKTLHLWFERFNRHWPEIEKLGFDKRFRRMWSYYLAYCEGGFASQNTDVLQMTLARQ
jgi:cyclopropane-fatty-acyl-phospholipid synthase